ncbi:2704_t:CDS:2, partial [Funneliformis caledonium]
LYIEIAGVIYSEQASFDPLSPTYYKNLKFILKNGNISRQAAFLYIQEIDFNVHFSYLKQIANKLVYIVKVSNKYELLSEYFWGWMMVIMEYLNGYLRLCDLDSQMKKKVEMSVMETVQIMYSENYVHDDLRSINIMISEGDVKFIDFDWSGKEEMIRYPYFINCISIKVWYSEMYAGALIRKTHNLHLLDHIFKDE